MSFKVSDINLVNSLRSLTFDDLWARAASEGINWGATVFTAAQPLTSTSSTISQIQPNSATEAFLINSIVLGVRSTTNANVAITLLNLTGPDYPSLHSSQTRYVLNTVNNNSLVIPVKKMIDGQISIQANADVNCTADISLMLDAYRITNDRDFNAEKVILFIGDSITRGTNLGGTVLAQASDNAYTAVSREDHFTFQVKQYFQRKGIYCRVVNKAMGNYDSNGIEGWRKRGWLDIKRADIMFYMMGANDAQNVAVTDSVFTANLNNILDLRNRLCPKATLVLLGCTSISDNTREARVAQLRTIMQNVASANSSNNVKYLSLEGLWDRTVLTNYNSNDGVHPNIANNVLMANAIKSWADTNNITF